MDNFIFCIFPKKMFCAGISAIWFRIVNGFEFWLKMMQFWITIWNILTSEMWLNFLLLPSLNFPLTRIIIRWNKSELGNLFELNFLRSPENSSIRTFYLFLHKVNDLNYPSWVWQVECDVPEVKNMQNYSTIFISSWSWF